MSASFLTTTVANMRIAVEIAWGADLTDLDGSGWSWSDVTDDVMLQQEQGVSITIGRPDFSSQTQTAELRCQLDNRDRAYSADGLSANWPNVRRGTPVRVRVSDDAGSSWSLRFQGSANGFTPQWDEETGRWATVELSASGPLRKLNQGYLPGFSAMRVGTMADPTVVAYWPMEDEQQSNYVTPAISNDYGEFRTMSFASGSSEPVVGVAGDFASYGNVPSSAPLMTLQQDSGVVFVRSSATSGSSSTVSMIFGNPASVPPGTNAGGVNLVRSALMNIYTPNGAAIKRWDLCFVGDGAQPAPGPGNVLALRTFSSATANANDFTFETEIAFGNFRPNTDYEIGVTLTQSGSTTTYLLWVNPCALIGDLYATSLGGTRSSNSNGAQIGDVQIDGYSDCSGMAVGHVVVRAPAMTLWGDEVWMRGHVGETPQARLARLCPLYGIHLDVITSSDVANVSVIDDMGPQYYDDITALIRECELTGQGVIFDGLGAGLTYVTKRRRETNASSAATLTLDANAGHLMTPFAPIDDDALTINHCDVSRRNATSASYIDRTGPMGTDSIGDYATSLTVNPETDEGLVHYAEWTVGLGTQVGYRYPTASFALEANAELISGWLDCLPQSRIDVTNVALIRRQHPDYRIRLLLEGWQEEITAFTWRVTANTSPAEPWNVVTLAAATGTTGDGVGRLQTVGSQLNANYTSGTTISVRTNSGNRWITTSEDSDSFPFDIDVGGVKATVTGITSTTSPQTFTLSAALPRTFTGSSTIGAGTPVKVWRPPVYGL